MVNYIKYKKEIKEAICQGVMVQDHQEKLVAEKEAANRRYNGKEEKAVKQS